MQVAGGDKGDRADRRDREDRLTGLTGPTWSHRDQSNIIVGITHLLASLWSDALAVTAV